MEISSCCIKVILRCPEDTIVTLRPRYKSDCKQNYSKDIHRYNSYTGNVFLGNLIWGTVSSLTMLSVRMIQDFVWKLRKPHDIAKYVCWCHYEKWPWRRKSDPKKIYYANKVSAYQSSRTSTRIANRIWWYTRIERLFTHKCQTSHITRTLELTCRY